MKETQNTRSYTLSESADKQLDELAKMRKTSRSAVLASIVAKSKLSDITLASYPKKMRCYELQPYALKKLATLAEKHEVHATTVIEELCLTLPE